jgi:hypothetical protein
LDGELTGDEMIVIRNHMSHCDVCREEYSSLQLVKKLLGTMQVVDAADEWSSNLATTVYADNKPWWEKSFSRESFLLHMKQSVDYGALTPRGMRMARALALSAVVVFLAAAPFASHERTDQGVTGRFAVSMGMPTMPWAADARSDVQNAGLFFQPRVDTRFVNVDSVVPSVVQYDMSSVPAIPSFSQSNWSSNSSLTFVSANEK